MTGKFLLSAVIGFIFTTSLFAQMKQDFAPIFKEIVKPPQSCAEADSMTFRDSTGKELIISDLITKQKTKFETIRNDITYSIKAVENDEQRMPMPPGDPGPRGDIQMPEDFRMMKKIMDKCRSASDEISAVKDNFKNKIIVLQDSLNRKLKLTMSDDRESRKILADEFLNSVKTEFDKEIITIELKSAIIDKAVKQYFSNKDLFIPPLMITLLKSQQTEINAAIFLLKITEECVKIGSKFYFEN
jgi:hypothetical protein